jgi:hypothetical protein
MGGDELMDVARDEMPWYEEDFPLDPEEEDDFVEGDNLDF